MAKKLDPTERFYAEALIKLKESSIPFLLGGTYAFNIYTNINRATHDLDIFCKTGDYPKILKLFEAAGYEYELTDERWLAKVMKGENFIDIIFNSTNSITPVNDSWFKRARTATLFDIELPLMPIEEMIWTKAYRQDKDRYDGPDINHLILKHGQDLDWKHILGRMENHWEILLAHLLNFRFVYPADRNLVPTWLIDELIERVKDQLALPAPRDKVCRGSWLSSFQYLIDVNEWGYKDNTY